MLRYKINKISEVETHKLSEFYKKIYHKRHKTLTTNWHWWYRAGHNGMEPLILSIDNKIIGQAGLLPVDLNILGKKTPAIWFVDFAILREFQGKGYGQILTKEWMKICPNQITFCNDLSLKIFKKFGWKNNTNTKRLALPINAFKFIPIIKKFEFNFFNSQLRNLIKRKYNQKVSINPYKISENFKIINDSFKEKKNVKNNEFAEIIRDEKWLIWRLMECPYKKDIFFFENKNNFAIAHIFSIKNIKKLNILFTYSTTELHESGIYMQIINWAIENNIDLVWAINNTKNLKNIFPKFLSKSVNFASWSADEKISKILQNGLLDSQGIDSDVDSNLYIEE